MQSLGAAHHALTAVPVKQNPASVSGQTFHSGQNAWGHAEKGRSGGRNQQYHEEEEEEEDGEVDVDDTNEAAFSLMHYASSLPVSERLGNTSPNVGGGM